MASPCNGTGLVRGKRCRACNGSVDNNADCKAAAVALHAEEEQRLEQERAAAAAREAEETPTDALAPAEDAPAGEAPAPVEDAPTGEAPALPNPLEEAIRDFETGRIE